MLVALPVWLPAAASGVDCLDTDSALRYWRPIKAQASTNELPADELAIELISCLGSPDPELRDGVGYELFTYWLREEKLTDDTREALLARLESRMSDSSQAATLSRSFSALILAELMRSDAATPFMTSLQRNQLLDSTISAIGSESDFRGLDAELGWIHPVAHLADLLWRFALHPHTSPDQATLLMAAVRSKVAPTDVAYAFNEGDRLARVIAVIVRRELIAADEIAGWIGEFESPSSMERWSEAFRSPAGMAELHNTKQFLRALSDQLAGFEFDPGISEVLDALVNGFTQLI